MAKHDTGAPLKADDRPLLFQLTLPGNDEFNKSALITSPQSIAEMAADAGGSRRTVRRSIKRLTACGYLRPVPR